MQPFSWLEIAGTLIGLVYLWLEYKASVYLWIASIVMPAVYLVVYYQAGLYADFGINVYYLLASFYGLFCWTRKSPSGGRSTPIVRTPRRAVLPLAAVTLAAFLAIGLVLERFTDSTVPWTDSCTTALSIAGMWMLSRKYLEQWLVWIAVDLISVFLYAYKGLPFTAGLYLLYAVIAVFGYRKWRSEIPNIRRIPSSSDTGR